MNCSITGIQRHYAREGGMRAAWGWCVRDGGRMAGKEGRKQEGRGGRKEGGEDCREGERQRKRGETAEEGG